MNQPTPLTSIENALLMMRIISGALIAGVVSFAGIICILPAQQHEGEPLLTYVAMVMAAACVAARFVVPDLLARKQMQTVSIEDNADRDATRIRVAGVYQSRLIVAQAMCEGPAFFNLIAWWQEGQTAAISVVGALILIMVASIPGRPRLDTWITHQIEEYRMENQ